ncbi:rhomboid family intramembrane serine protease [Prochlorothrix hollandica]|uniref:rhomboid family intramembrane serine protease n=1 Tax=Prochlorothrix hollandica TaxID=1223 RepID=UPI00334099FB
MDNDTFQQLVTLSQTTIGEPFPIFMGFIGFLWLLNLINIGITHGALKRHGILPRSREGLVGILFAPCLHGSWQHLRNNTWPLLLLGTFVMVQVGNYFYGVTLTIWAIGGIGVWIFGQDGVHLGASSLIWGYCGFILLHALFSPTVLSVLLAAIVVLSYGGMIAAGVTLQLQEQRVSWQSHQFGFAGGWLAARYSAEIQQGLGRVLDSLGQPLGF